MSEEFSPKNNHDSSDDDEEDRIRDAKEHATQLEAAKSGDPKAQTLVGSNFQYGFGVDIDHKEAIKWYRLASENGNTHAQINLGMCYEHGEGVDQDFKEAMRLYQLVAEQGNSVAQFMLGRRYEVGKITDQDVKAAVKWYRLAAENGDPYARMYLGKCYYQGIGVERDSKEAIKCYQSALELMRKIGIYIAPKEREPLQLLYKEIIDRYKDLRGEQNIKTAFKANCYIDDAKEVEKAEKNAYDFILLAVQKRETMKNQRMLAEHYETGLGVDKDEKKAFCHYYKSADQGDSEAQRKLAKYYKQGIAVKQDRQKAFELLQRSAGQGNTEALYELGKHYEVQAQDADKKSRDSSEEYRHFEALRKKYDRQQLIRQGLGDHEEFDPRKEAINCYQKSAIKGCWEAQAELIAQCLFESDSSRVEDKRKEAWALCQLWNFPMSRKESRKNPEAEKLWDSFLEFWGEQRPSAKEISVLESPPSPDPMVASLASSLHEGVFRRGSNQIMTEAESSSPMPQSDSPTLRGT